MSKYKSNTLFIIPFILIISISCNTPNQIESSDVKDTSAEALKSEFPAIDFIEVRDGILAIEDKESFKKLIDIMIVHQHNLDHFENQFKGFTSSQSAYSQLINQLEEYVNQNNALLNEETLNVDILSSISDNYNNFAFLKETNNNEYELAKVITPYLLSYIYNEDGLLIVKDKLYKYNNNNVIETDISNLSSLKSLNSNFDEAFKTNQVDYEVFPHISSSLSTNSYRFNEASCTNNYKSNRRLVGTLERYTVNAPVENFSCLGVSTVNQRKRFGFWTPRKARRLDAIASGYYTLLPSSSPQIFQVGASQNDTNSIHIQIYCTFSSIGSDLAFEPGTSSTHIRRYSVVPGQSDEFECNIDS